MKSLALFSRIAFRNVRRNIRRSALTVAAISFGLVCLAVFQALKTGLHEEMVRSTVTLDAGSFQIHAAGYEPNLALLKPLDRPDLVISNLVKEGFNNYSRRLRTSGLLLSGRKSATVLLTGVDPKEERRVTIISEKMIKGGYLTGGLVLGNEVARSLGLGIGDEVTLMAQDSDGRPTSGTFRIGGIYRTELASFDRTHLFLPLADCQTFLRADDAINEIAVLESPDRSGPATGPSRSILPGTGYRLLTWQEVAPDVKQLIELNDATMQLLTFIVFAIIAMGITNTMTMGVFERFRELGTLSAIGTSPWGIVFTIVMESFFLGLIAALIGGLAATGACSYLASHGVDLTRLTSSNQYFATSHVLKAHLTAYDFFSSISITVMTALLGSIYPAWKAAAMNPVDAINHV